VYNIKLTLVFEDKKVGKVKYWLGTAACFAGWAVIFMGVPRALFAPNPDRFISLGMTLGWPLLAVLAVLLLPRAAYKLDAVWAVGAGVLWACLQWQTLTGSAAFMQTDTDMKTGVIYFLAWLLFFVGLVVMVAAAAIVLAVRSPRKGLYPRYARTLGPDS